MKKKIILSISLIFIFTNKSYAYLDPVSGTFIIQGLIALIATIIFYIRNPRKIFYDLKKYFNKKLNKDKDKIN